MNEPFTKLLENPCINRSVRVDKPVVTIHLTGRTDPVDYAEKGVAIGVYTENDLSDAINNILYNEETRKSLAEMRKDYISDYLLNGKAKENIGDIVEEMVTE